VTAPSLGRPDPGPSGQVLTADAVESTRASAGTFGGKAAREKARLLRENSTRVIKDARVLLAYHDCLLFMLAYPETVALRAQADGELRRLAGAARRLAGRKRDELAFEGSGVAWSRSRAAFSFPVARWLVDRYPDHVEFERFGEGAESLDSILALCLPEIEETILTKGTSGELLDVLSSQAGRSRLGWLIDAVNGMPGSEKLRDHVYGSLRVQIVVRPGDGEMSRTFGRGLPHEPFVHREGLIRHVDPLAIMSEALPRRRTLARAERVRLVEAARGLLAVLGRETEPISLCQPEGVEYLELGRGVAISLCWMPPGRRLPLDSHVGFVLFKNAMPVAYGGGWPFLSLCRIGVNIFEAYRGGESAYLFSQVLRVYRQRFGVQRFLVEAYQFGADNPEGIHSGAFWFYYRLGFRPVEPRLAQLAEGEFARMVVDRAYRTPPAVLRRFARSDLELLVPGDGAMEDPCDPADLSMAISRWIGRRFRGDRVTAEREAIEQVTRSLGVQGMERWPEDERRAFRSLSLLMALVDDLDGWAAADKRALVALMRAKGGLSEQAYFDRMRAHPRFRQAMFRLASGASLGTSGGPK